MNPYSLLRVKPLHNPFAKNQSPPFVVCHFQRHLLPPINVHVKHFYCRFLKFRHWTSDSRHQTFSKGAQYSFVLSKLFFLTIAGNQSLLSVFVAVIPAKAGIQGLLDSGAHPCSIRGRPDSMDKVVRNDSPTPEHVKPVPCSFGCYTGKSTRSHRPGFREGWMGGERNSRAEPLHE